MTISDAQDRLSDALENIKIPDDMTDWDMEDWTIFALEYLRSNLEDALEGASEEEESEIPKTFEKESPLWRIIFNALKTTGNYCDALSYMEENLTFAEYEEMNSFFGWLMKNQLTIGHGNYWFQYQSYKMNEPKSVKALWAELGDIPVNDDGEIQLGFVDFPPGTDREEIWHWFEETFDVSIANLMNLKGE